MKTHLEYEVLKNSKIVILENTVDEISATIENGKNTVFHIRREQFESNRSGKYVEECFLEFTNFKDSLSCENIISAYLATGDHLAHFKSIHIKTCNIKLYTDYEKVFGSLKVSFDKAKFDLLGVGIYPFSVESFEQGILIQRKK